MGKFINSFLESNRWKHFLVSLFGSLLLTIGFAIGANLACEYKDKAFYGVWDWKDLGFGVLGGTIGQLIQILILLLIF